MYFGVFDAARHIQRKDCNKVVVEIWPRSGADARRAVGLGHVTSGVSGNS